MKKSFITGLVILLPVALTVAILIFFFNLLTEPFAGISKAVMARLHVFENGFLFFTADQTQQLIGQLAVLAILFLFTIGLGIVARWVLVNYFFALTDRIFHKIPFISTIYKTCNEIINTIFASKTNSFKQVVLVRFPNPETYSIGLVTREGLPAPREPGSNNHIAVFVPTTPNPTSGFLVMFKESDVVFLSMKVDEAFKYIISCGMIAAPFQEIVRASSEAPLEARP